VIRNVREAANELGKIVALMLDTKGPEIRSGKLKNNDKVFLEKGAEFTFTTDQNFLGDEKKVSTTYEHLCQTTKVGDKILVDDGLIQFRVIEVSLMNFLFYLRISHSITHITHKHTETQNHKHTHT
jgi:pyruvate kinase